MQYNCNYIVNGLEMMSSILNTIYLEYTVMDTFLQLTRSLPVWYKIGGESVDKDIISVNWQMIRKDI